MADSVEHIKKTARLYLLIGAVLFIFTGVTVAVAKIPMLDVGKHGFDTMDMILGLAIASFKASLVGYIFMHLNHEKKAIYWIFISALVLCASMFAILFLAKYSPIFDSYFYL